MSNNVGCVTKLGFDDGFEYYETAIVDTKDGFNMLIFFISLSSMDLIDKMFFVEFIVWFIFILW